MIDGRISEISKVVHNDNHCMVSFGSKLFPNNIAYGFNLMRLGDFQLPISILPQYQIPDYIFSSPQELLEKSYIITSQEDTTSEERYNVTTTIRFDGDNPYTLFISHVENTDTIQTFLVRMVHNHTNGLLFYKKIQFQKFSDGGWECMVTNEERHVSLVIKYNENKELTNYKILGY